MEELRPVLADRVRAQPCQPAPARTPTIFVVETAGGVRLTDDGRKTVLVAWQNRKREEATPIRSWGEKAPPRPVRQPSQAQMLARSRLRGDLDGYPAFIWK